MKGYEEAVTTSARDQHSSRHLLDAIRKTIPFAQGLVITSLPRGDLQIAQPSSVPEALLKAYSGGFHTEDRLTWQAIVQGRAVRAADFWEPEAFRKTAYFTAFLEPAGLRYVLSAPLAAPVVEGYPGAVHLCRTAEQRDFSKAEVDQLAEFVRGVDQQSGGGRASRRTGASATGASPAGRPAVYLTVVDEKLRPPFAEETWSALDQRLRSQLADRARKRMHTLNGHPVLSDRLHVADSHGDQWIFRQVTYRRYPALGSGPYTFFCLQPDCNEWSVIRPADFQADPELARLIPALRFMQQEYSRGPTLTEIARTVNLSPFHFHRRFTELLGLTPKQFMLGCQVYLAKAELLAGEKELIQIARICGFAHQSHFTSRFKQATGLTPTRWRRMAQLREAASES